MGIVPEKMGLGLCYDDDYFGIIQFEKLGLRNESGGFNKSVTFQDVEYWSLQAMNDCGLTFKEIARFIRNNESEVFV